MTTIVLLVSRDFLLDRLFLALDHLECYSLETNLLVIVDGDIGLFLKTKELVAQSKFNEKLCIRADEPRNRSKSQEFRRNRIATLHNLAGQYIQECDYIFTIEDDGILPPDALTKLHKHMQEHPEAGFISGLEIGRWSTPYIGGWLFDDPKDPKELRSVKPPEAPGLVKVHAAGWYCCLVKSELYEGFKHQPTRHYGPDLYFGRVISAQGHQNYMDTSIVVDHHNEGGKVFNMQTTKPRDVHMKLRNGTWRFVHNVVH